MMGISQHYLKDHGFVLTRVTGFITNTILCQSVFEFNREIPKIPNLRELADCRGVTDLEELTVPGVVSAARKEEERPGSLLAILITDCALQHGMARAYQTFSAVNGKEVEIFYDINEALSWLAKDEREAVALKTFVESTR